MDLSDIINKTADITADTLRGYLSILLNERYGETNWKDDLLPRFARKAQSRASYASTYKKVVTHIEHVGVEHYSLQDMDISFLCAVLLFDLCDRYCQDAPQIEIPQSIRRAIELLRDDKNESDSHRGRGAAEPLYNQLRSAIIWQNDLFRFIAELEANMSQMGKQRELLALLCSKTRIDIKGIENLIKRHFSEAPGSA